MISAKIIANNFRHAALEKFFNPSQNHETNPDESESEDEVSLLGLAGKL